MNDLVIAWMCVAAAFFFIAVVVEIEIRHYRERKHGCICKLSHPVDVYRKDCPVHGWA